MNSKHYDPRLYFLCFLLAAMCLFAGCGDGVTHGVQTEDGFKNTDTGIEYIVCNPLSVKPWSLDQEKAYCVVDGVSYYTVDFEDPTRILSDYDEASGSCFVYRNKDLPEITVENFDAIAARIYIDGLTPVWIDDLYADDEYLPDEKKGLNPTQDTALVRKITDALVNGDVRAVSDDEVDPNTVYHIRLTGPNYPGLYYDVCFFGTTYGRYYVEDFRTYRIVDAPSELVVRMIG